MSDSKHFVWERANPEALRAFDPHTKECTMNCGRSMMDPRSDKERKFLCEDCVPVQKEK